MLLGFISLEAREVFVGEISRLDLHTGQVEVLLDDSLAELKHLESQELMISNSLGAKRGKLIVQKIMVKEDKFYLQAAIKERTGRLSVGMRVSLELEEKVESILPDSLREEVKEPLEKYYPKDGAIGVYIPEGKFLFGSEIPQSLHYASPPEMKRKRYEELSSRPSRNYLDLPAFYIDKYEITRRQFTRFLEEQGLDFPPTWKESGDGELPAMGVSYRLAEAYCRWAGRRLPSELEWEKAARGSGLEGYINEKEEFIYIPQPRKYPIGYEFDAQLCNTEESGRGLIPVREMKDASPYGVYGMCGNAPEWTSSWLLPYRGNTLPHLVFGRKYKVIRGGSAFLPRRFARVYERMVGGIPSLEEDFRAGFRCAETVR